MEGEEAIGIPGYDSDNVAGIAAKARRRLLQALWIKVSPILSTDQYDEDIETVAVTEQPEVKVIPVEHEKADKKTEADNFEEIHDKTLDYLAADNAATDVFRSLWIMIDNATTPKDFAAAYDECNSAKVGL